MKSIKSKILIVILPVVIIGSGTIVLSFLLAMNNSTLSALEYSMHETVNAASIASQNMLNGYKSLAEQLAMDPTLTQELPAPGSSDYDRIYEEKVSYAEQIRELHGVQYVRILDEYGTDLATEGSVATQEYFEVIRDDNVPYADIIVSTISGELGTIIAAPIMRNGEFIGGISFGLDPALFSEMLAPIEESADGSITIIDNTGTLIASNNVAEIYDRYNAIEVAKTDSSVIPLATVEADLLAGNSGFTTIYAEGHEQVIYYIPVENTNGWGLYGMAHESLFFSEVTSASLRSSLIAVGVALAVLLAVILVANSISKTAKRCAEQLPAVADGDFTVELEVTGNDEISTMAGLVNDMVKKTRTSLLTLAEEAGTLGAIGEKLAGDASESAGAVHQIASNVETMKEQVINEAAGVEEIYATIGQIATRIESLDSEIKKQANSIADSTAATEEMVANINSVTSVLSKNEEEVKQLSAAAEKGRETIDTTTSITEKISSQSDGLLEASNIIQSIVSQTSLLAMNAAIEAAHAGEAGKGFAVVADEIRKLAETAGTQSKSITQVLGELKVGIEGLSENAQFVQKQFASIFDLINNVQIQEATVSNMMQEQSTANDQVLQSMHEIASITRLVQDGSIQILTGSHEIRTEVQKLNEITTSINAGMDEVSTGASDIRNASQNVNNMSKETKESIGRAKEHLAKFTL